MEWDLGVLGFTTLLAMAMGFGLLAQVLWGKGTTRWLWLIGAMVYLISGLLISEAWFGWATEEELQPNIDGLSRDESLMALFPALAAVFMTRHITKGDSHRGRPYHA